MKNIIYFIAIITLNTKDPEYEKRFKEIKKMEQENNYLADVNNQVETVKDLDSLENKKDADTFYVSDEPFFKDQAIVTKEPAVQLRFKQNPMRFKETPSTSEPSLSRSKQIITVNTTPVITTTTSFSSSLNCDNDWPSCAVIGALLPPNSACWNGLAWVDCTSIGYPVHSV